MAYRAGSSPRAAVCFIEDKFFNSKHCARNFANYVAHRMSIIPLIMPQYKFPKDIHGKPNFSRWWKGEDRWEKWKDYALFINMQKDPKQVECLDVLVVYCWQFMNFECGIH